MLRESLRTASYLPRDNTLALIAETVANGGRSMSALLDILADYGVEEISEYLSEYLVGTIQNAPGARTIRREGLYVANVRHEQGTWKLFLGAQLLSTEVPLMTVQEIYDSYRWGKGCKELVVAQYVRKSIEAWANYQLSLVISRKIYPQVDALNNGVRLWVSLIGHSDDPFLLDRMVRTQRRVVRKLEKQEVFLRLNKAPHCLRRELEEDIKTAKFILESISR